ncbi:COG2944 Predicted transcriptional regulator [Burkholderiaceae bacterium]
MYHYTDGGLRNIWLANGYERVETPYGKALIIQDLPGLTRAICKALIRKNSKLTGAEFRYLRQAMLMSQASLGRTLGRTDQAIAGWEKNSKVPKFADQMLRVVYAAHADGNEQVKNIIHAMNDVERTINFVMTETKMGWQSKVSAGELSDEDDCELSA